MYVFTYTGKTFYMYVKLFYMYILYIYIMYMYMYVYSIVNVLASTAPKATGISSTRTGTRIGCHKVLGVACEQKAPLCIGK